jgi:hypothetical protein
VEDGEKAVRGEFVLALREIRRPAG